MSKRLSTRATALAAAYAATLIGSGFAAARASQGGEGPEPYEELVQAPFAPPAWLFGPAWTVNKVGTTWSVARLLGARASRDRSVALAAAAVNDLTFVAFAPVYFKARSPIGAAAITCTSAVATVVQLAATGRVDRAAAAALLPQTAWLALATPVAIYQATHNPDPVFGT